MEEFDPYAMMPHRMNGQLGKRPLAELIREISAKSQSGRLRLERDRVKVAAYFDNGKFVYAASNVRTFRLREYLLKAGLLTADQLAGIDERLSDFDLARRLCSENLSTPEAVQQVQARQVSDILRLALLWSDGTFEFDPRSHLDESVNLNVDLDALLLEAERRMPSKADVEPSRDTGPEDVNSFLERLRRAESHYDVLGVANNAAAADLKSAYYDLARRFHPDRFRKSEPALLTRMESAFARITQAYDVLRDNDLRANYDAKLQARRKAQRITDAAPKPSGPVPTPSATSDTAAAEPQRSAVERAENDFKEGFAALEQGQRSVAAGLFASAARLAPNEPRYRAFYGQMLATQESTRRAAEAELQAAVKLDPGNAEYRVMLAELFKDLGFTIRARGEAERAVAADPNNRKARDLLRQLKGV